MKRKKKEKIVRKTVEIIEEKIKGKQIFLGLNENGHIRLDDLKIDIDDIIDQVLGKEVMKPYNVTINRV